MKCPICGAEDYAFSIALANAIREHNEFHGIKFNIDQLNTLADFCHFQNPSFDRHRWLDYIAGKCGPNGGRIK